jgi:hypothetical protein
VHPRQRLLRRGRIVLLRNARDRSLHRENPDGEVGRKVYLILGHVSCIPAQGAKRAMTSDASRNFTVGRGGTAPPSRFRDGMVAASSNRAEAVDLSGNLHVSPIIC